MRRLVVISLALVSSLGLVAPALGAPPFPDRIPVPDGSYPEGIAVGYGHDFYVGSLLDGSIYRGDLRTGDGEVIAPGEEGRLTVGLSFDRRSGLLWAAGVEGGFAAGERVILAFDGRTGAVAHRVAIPGGMFLNDLVVARDAIFVTDSFGDRLWTVPLTARGAPAGAATAIPLSGDFELVTTGELPINLNGIDVTPDGRTLLAVHTSLGVLYRIDPTTGHATTIDLGGASLPTADGILLHGRTLYVVQNFLDQIAVVRLDPGFAAGTLVDTITSDGFRVPTTVARFGGSLYAVNARFDAAFPPSFGGVPQVLDYDVVRVDRR
jgi:sugar lactone lactonase YvrE